MATQDIDGTAPPESCTPKDLLEIVRGGGELVLMPSRAYDEVYPDIYISERSVLKAIGSISQRTPVLVLNRTSPRRC